MGFEITVFFGFSNINAMHINRSIKIVLITTSKLNNTLVKNKTETKHKYINILLIGYGIL